MFPIQAIFKITFFVSAILLPAFTHPISQNAVDIVPQMSTRDEQSLLKRGLPFNDPPLFVQHFNGGGSKVGWAYNWNSVTDGTFPDYLEFVPMLWSNSLEQTSKWLPNIALALAQGKSHHLLAFNEPDICGNGGSCMTPEVAAATYLAFIQPLAGKFRLGAPAVTNGPSGLPWLTEFLRLCTGCTIDFVPIHWYDRASNSVYFRSYLEQVHNVVGTRNIWLTEFSGSGTEEEQKKFMADVLPWMDSLPWVERYAWFWCDPSSQMGRLVDSGASLTALGERSSPTVELKAILGLGIRLRL